MTKEEALQKSIRHWEEILGMVNTAENTIIGLPLGGAHCALCQKYSKNGCNNCPLAEVGHCCVYAQSLYAKVTNQHEHLTEALKAFRNICKRMLVTLETAQIEE